MSRRDEQLREEYAEKVTNIAIQQWILATAMALHNELGFGEMRIHRMLKAIEKESKSFTSGWIEFETYKEYVYEQTGFKLEEKE